MTDEMRDQGVGGRTSAEIGADRVFVALGETPDAETKAKLESGEWECVGATMGGTFPSDSMPAGVWYGPKKRKDGLG